MVATPAPPIPICREPTNTKFDCCGLNLAARRRASSATMGRLRRQCDSTRIKGTLGDSGRIAQSTKRCSTVKKPWLDLRASSKSVAVRHHGVPMQRIPHEEMILPSCMEMMRSA